MEAAFATAIQELIGPGGALEVGSKGPLRVFAKGPQTLQDLYVEAWAAHAERTLLLLPESARSVTRVSYGDFFAEARSLARGLRTLGVAGGTRVAIGMANCRQWLTAFVATTVLGAVAVALNSLSTGDELADLIEHCDPALAVLDITRARRLGPRLLQLSKSGVHFVFVPGANEDVSDLTGADGIRVYEDLLVAGAQSEVGADFPNATIDADDDVCIFYTSGTEGRPKGAVSTHGAVMQSLLSFHLPSRAGKALLPPGVFLPPPSRLLATPLFHISGCHTNFLMSLFDGGSVAVMRRWDATLALDLIERERITLFSGPPAMVMEMLDHPSIPSRDLSCLVNIGFGGSATPGVLIRRVPERIPSAQPGTGWGGTETNGQGTTAFGPAWIARPDAVGHTSMLVDLKTVEPESAEDLPNGAEGELCIRSPCNFRCYWRDDAATQRATLPGGWFRTGDVGIVGADGLVRIVGRSKEVIIRGGENISAAEVEAALMEHADVAECCVYGELDPKFGEAVTATVVPRPGRILKATDVHCFAAERLARHKVPQEQAIFVTERPLPRGATGKVLRRVVRAAGVPESRL